jgi:hypothetical protein
MDCTAPQKKSEPEFWTRRERKLMAWLAIPALLWLAMPAHLACILSFQWLNGGQMAVEKAAGTLP